VSTTYGTHDGPSAEDIAAVVTPVRWPARSEHAVAQFCGDAARVINLAIDARRFGEVSCNFI
jgi:hypothetical protein